MGQRDGQPFTKQITFKVPHCRNKQSINVFSGGMEDQALRQGGDNKKNPRLINMKSLKTQS